MPPKPPRHYRPPQVGVVDVVDVIFDAYMIVVNVVVVNVVVVLVDADAVFVVYRLISFLLLLMLFLLTFLLSMSSCCCRGSLRSISTVLVAGNIFFLNLMTYNRQVFLFVSATAPSNEICREIQKFKPK